MFPNIYQFTEQIYEPQGAGFADSTLKTVQTVKESILEGVHVFCCRLSWLQKEKKD
jgi:hypothetical protein